MTVVNLALHHERALRQVSETVLGASIIVLLVLDYPKPLKIYAVLKPFGNVSVNVLVHVGEIVPVATKHVLLIHLPYGLLARPHVVGDAHRLSYD